MAVRRKTISKKVRVAPGASPSRRSAHPQGKPAHDARQTDKILELEWEALGRKLNKLPGGESGEVEKLRRQLRDREEQLKYAESVIARLKAELRASQGAGQKEDKNRNKPLHDPQKQKPGPQSGNAAAPSGKDPRKKSRRRPHRNPVKADKK